MTQEEDHLSQATQELRIQGEEMGGGGDAVLIDEGERQEMIEWAEGFVKEAFRNHDPSHDWHHVHRVRLLALSLSNSPCLQGQGIDMLVLELGALFHDLCDHKYLAATSTALETKAQQQDLRLGNGNRVRLAEQVLEPFFLRFPALEPGRRETIYRIVENVSWSKDEARRRRRQQEALSRGVDLQQVVLTETEAWINNCKEFWCVSDADRLDAIGSIGILRCAAFSAIKNRPLHIPPANPQGDSIPPAEQAPGYNESAIAHFHEKLVKIRGDRLFTQSARSEAERRQQLMQSFLTELDIEWMVAEQGAQISQLSSYP
ncbi:hypothetical protein IE53DRAFT_384289 [Violaceomyces palustris]|uniref:Uncharacterized protein n=1 Tax=Violaceomyces palustris TaxID=1673888 RepID=A0ACD0P5A1_9BASI|nr:hypothetical protein IE53DRAFT_384289 [Violaceomyces palustris]